MCTLPASVAAIVYIINLLSDQICAPPACPRKQISSKVWLQNTVSQITDDYLLPCLSLPAVYTLTDIALRHSRLKAQPIDAMASPAANKQKRVPNASYNDTVTIQLILGEPLHRGIRSRGRNHGAEERCCISHFSRLPLSVPAAKCKREMNPTRGR